MLIKSMMSKDQDLVISLRHYFLVYLLILSDRNNMLLMSSGKGNLRLILWLPFLDFLMNTTPDTIL